MKCRAVCTIDPVSSSIIFVWLFFDEAGKMAHQILFSLNFTQKTDKSAAEIKKILGSFRKLSLEPLTDEVYAESEADTNFSYRSTLTARTNLKTVEAFIEGLDCFAVSILYEDSTLTDAAAKIIEFFEIRQLCNTTLETVEAYQKLEQFAQG